MNLSRNLIFIYLLLCCEWCSAQDKVLQRTFPGNGCTCIPVSVSQQPVSPPSVCAYNGVVQFTVVICGTAPFTYQWRENGMLLTDNAVYSGTNTATLIITNPPDSLNGKNYRCVITGCNSSCVVTNYNAVLTITQMPTDFNNDGITDTNDFIILQSALNTTCNGCPEDITSDGIVDMYDFLQLLGKFNQACTP